MSQRSTWFPRSTIRSIARQRVREGFSAGAIAAELDNTFDEAIRNGSTSRAQINRIINSESRRQEVVDKIIAKPKSRRTNLHALVGCGRGEKVQTRITVRWLDERTGAQRTFGWTTTLANQGRLQDILNPALREVAEYAQGKGYSVPNITSSMTGGNTFYRLEYVECV